MLRRELGAATVAGKLNVQNDEFRLEDVACSPLARRRW
jgi:hypothetical protein